MNIFIDLDGTIVDSSERHFQVYKKIVNGLGGMPMPKDEYWELIRDRANKEIILEKSALSNINSNNYLDKFIDEIEEAENLKFEKLISPNALKVLERLAKKHQLFLVTQRKEKKSAEEQIQSLGLAHYFEKTIICPGDKADLIKPYLDSDLSNNLMIGDTEADINAAKKLGIRSIGLLSGFRNEQLIRGLEPDYVCYNIGKIEETIKKWK